jgi:holin-like protein
MIKGIATLLGFQLAGEIAARLAHLPVSGPICGMAALLVWLHVKREVGGELGRVCDGILANMALLFVPVGVGAMSYSGLFAATWPVIALAILAGGCATLLTTAFVTRALSDWTGRHATAEGRGKAAVSDSYQEPSTPTNPS